MYFDDFKVEHIKGPVVESQSYYPFGLNFNSYSRENSTPNNFKYNSKELQDELGLGWLDYGARMYMPDIGRWGGVDNMATKFPQLSVYNYVDNDPVHNTDPDGNIIQYGLFKKETRQALRYLARNSETARKDINRIRWSLKVVSINGNVTDVSGENRTDPRKIEYSPYHGNTTADGEVMSPALRLAHEIAHAAEALRRKDLNDPKSAANTEVDPKTGNNAQEDKTTQREAKIAAEINQKVQDGSPEGTRSNYGDNGESQKVNSPISNVPVSKFSDAVKQRISENMKKLQDANKNNK